MGARRADIVELAILDDRDSERPPGEVGELAVRPKLPEVLLESYYEKPERTLEEFSNLWFHTGDMAYRDEDGNYYFVDRKGDVIRRRGENISTMQIQDAVNEHDAIVEAAAFPLPAEEENGEDEIGLAATVDAGDRLSEAELRSFLEDRLPSFMHPDHMFFVDAIPTTETNKREKYKLRDLVDARR
jgi:crotonobetaine/carnitine-CoA ligase